MIDKKKLSRRFSKNAHQYDKYAVVQKHMSSHIIDMIKEAKPEKILEIGCGTGYLTKLILDMFPSAQIRSVDIAPGMIKYARKNIQSEHVNFECVDIEEMDLGIEEYDLVISNATFQWLNNLEKTSEKIIRALRNGGIMCFSTFGENTFNELRLSYDKAYRNAEQNIMINSNRNTSSDTSQTTKKTTSQKFFSQEEIRELYSDRYEGKLCVEESYEYHYFNSCLEFFYSVKKVGANNCQKNSQECDINLINEMIQIYENEFKFESGIRATYHKLYVMFVKNILQ
jgi:malonyl-CoA O-methyltransferase